MLLLTLLPGTGLPEGPAATEEVVVAVKPSAPAGPGIKFDAPRSLGRLVPTLLLEGLGLA